MDGALRPKIVGCCIPRLVSPTRCATIYSSLLNGGSHYPYDIKKHRLWCVDELVVPQRDDHCSHCADDLSGTLWARWRETRIFRRFECYRSVESRCCAAISTILIEHFPSPLRFVPCPRTDRMLDCLLGAHPARHADNGKQVADRLSSQGQRCAGAR